MSQATVWWVLAGLMVGLELLTGTLYLLMVAVGMAAGALASHLGLELAMQIVVAALSGGLAVLVMQKWRPRPSSQPSAANSDVNMDIGALVNVTEWLPNGTAQVKHRGAQWSVAMESVDQNALLPGSFKVVAVRGSQLLVRPA